MLWGTKCSKTDKFKFLILPAIFPSVFCPSVFCPVAVKCDIYSALHYTSYLGSVVANVWNNTFQKLLAFMVQNKVLSLLKFMTFQIQV